MSDVKRKIAITGRQIAAARELLDITQEGLCAACGLQKAILARIEKGKVAPRQLKHPLIFDFPSLTLVMSRGTFPSVTKI